MNVYVENEKKLISLKIEELVNEAKNSNRGEFILGNDGRAVAKDKLEAYNALVRMMEILNNNFTNLKSKFEYYELYEIAGLPKMEDSYYKLLTDGKKPLNDEYIKVQKRIDELELEAKNVAKNMPITNETLTGNFVCLKDKEEYDALIKMRNFLDNNFLGMKSTFDYMDLRVKTGLGQMNDFEYYALIGKVPEKVYQFKVADTPKKDPINPEIPKKDDVLSGEVIDVEQKDKGVTQTEGSIPTEEVIDVDYVDVQPKQPGPAIPLGPGAGMPIGLPPHIEPQHEPPKPPITPEPPKPEPPKPEPPKPPVTPEPPKPGQPKPPVGPDSKKRKPAKEPKLKVVAKKTWNWIKTHKKQILIGLGLAALAVAVVVGISYLLPAIQAAMQASQVSTLSTAMLNNGALWHGAIASEQVALHGANTALASMIEAMSGSKAIFDTATGVWTIGGAGLSQFAGAAAANAAAASAAVSSLSNAAMGLGLTGLGLTGLGLLSKNKSSKYKELAKAIATLEKKMDELDPEVVKQYIAEIVRTINVSVDLTAVEKKRLLKKTDALTRKMKHKIDKKEKQELEQEEIFEEERPIIGVAM